MAGYQQSVINQFERALQDRKASPMVRKALYEAGIVESHLQNLNYGDRDSLGSLQERTSIYGRKQALSPYASAVRFIDQAQPIAAKYGTAGQLAQAVQRSAYPGRYDQQSGAAQALLKGSPAPSRSVSPQAASGGTAAPDARKQIALSLIGFGNLAGGYSGGSDPLTTALLQAAKQGKAPQGQTAGPNAYGGKAPTGVATFDGKPVAGWIAPILKQARSTGLWKGNVTSGERTKQQQLSAAKHFGLQNYGPKGPLASNHVYGNAGAVDVSDPQGLKRALAHLGITNLRSAMPNDPVHFSKTGY